MPTNPRAKYDIVADDKTRQGLQSAQRRVTRFSKQLRVSLLSVGTALGAVQFARAALGS